jgi:RNA polymerase sigma factor (sigma-70 family)
MAGRQPHPILRFLRQLAGGAAGDETADGQLLRRFAGQREEAAFAALVQRHGPMVLGVCRRVLRDPHDVDDAFQATFLVLARKAGSLSRPEKLANWLYGVACRTAARAKAQAVRRRVHERQFTAMPTADAQTDGGESVHELRFVLDEELRRLPEKYRGPLVLCYLEGKTYAEAARALGWAEGTVSGRLARAREVLRGRLTRRGLALSTGAFATSFSESSAPAAVPPTLAEVIAKAATLFANGTGVGSASAAALAEGVLRTMSVTRRNSAAAFALVSSLVAIGAGLFAYDAPATPPPQPPAVRSAEPAREQATAAEVFGSFEKRVQDAKSLFIAYVSEVTQKGSQETTRRYDAGTYHVRPGHAATVMQLFKPDKLYSGPWSVGPGRYHYGPITRSGFFPWFGMERPQDMILPPVADFTLVKPKAGTAPTGTSVVTYTLYTTWGMEQIPENARQVELWLDEKSLVPIKRTVRSGHVLDVTERYYGFSTGEVPAPFEGEPAGFVEAGRLATKIKDDWVETPWLVKGNRYRAGEKTLVIFDYGVKVTVAEGAEFTVGNERRELRLTRGQLFAELPIGDDYCLAVGPARIRSWYVRGLENRVAVVTSTPDRVVVEQGGVACEGATAEPSSVTEAYYLRLLHKGVEYRLADGKLEGQKERTLPRPDDAR